MSGQDELCVSRNWELCLRQALRDAIRHQESQLTLPEDETSTGDPAGQIGLYLALARDFGISVGPGGGS